MIYHTLHCDLRLAKITVWGKGWTFSDVAHGEEELRAKYLIWNCSKHADCVTVTVTT